MSSKATVVGAVPLFVLLWLGIPTFDEAKNSSPQQALDPTIKSCRDLAVAEAHLDAAFHTVTKKYETIPGQEKPVPNLEGIETPEKVQGVHDVVREWRSRGNVPSWTVMKFFANN